MARGRTTPLLVAAAGLGALAAVWLLAHAPSPARALDGRAFDVAQRVAHRTGLDPIGELLVLPIRLPLYAALCAAAVLLIARRRGTPAALGVGTLLLVTNVAAQLLKSGLATARPWSLTPWGPVDAASWPSGHATASAVLVLAWALAVSPAARPLVVAFGGAWAVLVGAAVVWMGWHLPSDTLGGWCLVTVAGGLAVAVARSAPRRAARAPVRPAQSPA